MSHDCETVEIQGEPSEGNPSGVIVINKSDFVEGMQLVGEEAPKTTKTPKASKVAEPAVEPPVVPEAPVTPEPPVADAPVVQPWLQAPAT